MLETWKTTRSKGIVPRKREENDLYLEIIFKEILKVILISENISPKGENNKEIL